MRTASSPFRYANAMSIVELSRVRQFIRSRGGRPLRRFARCFCVWRVPVALSEIEASVNGSRTRGKSARPGDVSGRDDCNSIAESIKARATTVTGDENLRQLCLIYEFGDVGVMRAVLDRLLSLSGAGRGSHTQGAASKRMGCGTFRVSLKRLGRICGLVNLRQT